VSGRQPADRKGGLRFQRCSCKIERRYAPALENTQAIGDNSVIVRSLIVVSMSTPREVELKLEIPPQSIARLTRSSLLNGRTKAMRKPASLVSVYFDTKKLKLRNNGFSLRVRRTGRKHMQTVKNYGAETTTLVARNEWEHEIADNEPDLDKARDTPLGRVLGKKACRKLNPLFETRVRRKVYPIHEGVSEIELTVDKGSVAAGRRSSPICEVELELKRGEVADLFKAARILAEEVPVQLATSSKAERGYSLIEGRGAAPVKAASVGLTPHTTCALAFHAIARACLRQLVANRPAMLGGDPDGLHQMRVALRRLRAAISLFGDMLCDHQTEEMKVQLKWITGELGPAREFEVFVKRVLMPVAAAKPDGPGVAVLTRDLEEKRAEAFHRARAAVESARFRTLMIDTAAWIENGDWTHNGHASVSALRESTIAAVAAHDLSKRRKKILKNGSRLKELEPQRRHKLRIQAKKLRYASEFFAGAFPGKKPRKRRKEFLAALEKLQDALGDLNDIAVHEGLTAEIIDASAADGKRGMGRARKAFAAGRLSGREEARAPSVLNDAQHAYRLFAAAKPYWL
jgi:triphosphatase